jgi:nitrite reductase (cytochrome c-552)
VKQNRIIWILSAVIIALALALGGVFVFLSNQPAVKRGPQLVTPIEPLEPDAAKWAVNFSRQYDTWLKTREQISTTWGGSQPYSKLERDPRLKTLFAGYSFSKEYNEERGHYWAVEDVSKTLRAPTAGTCWTCKSAVVPGLMKEMGPDKFYATPFKELAPLMTHTIACADCHNAETMELTITRPALQEALAAQGKDWKQATRQEMRTLVCSQCHVEYYFKGQGNYLTFPWEKGTRIEQIEAYYDSYGFKDWTHPQTGAPMLKMQHPESEFYTAGSTHYAAGVACADCHMPYVRDGATKYTSHWIASPLQFPEKACGPCHRDVEYVKQRVTDIQLQTMTTMSRTEESLVAAISAIQTLSNTVNADPKALEQARLLHRRAQMRWDFIAAENSAGFHNPEEALRIMAEAIDYARQAELAARQAIKP